jgi:hypothetical protein
MTIKKFLHVGCGFKRKSQTTKGFNTENWSELRLDIDLSVAPDLVGSMTDLSAIKPGSIDAIFSSHNIEHLYPHEVSVALGEFLRILAEDGFVIITCPDLRSVCSEIAHDKLTEPLYLSPAGPIAGIDILYGHRASLAKGNIFMAHRCGFTQKVLQGTLRDSGFSSVATFSRGYSPFFDLWALASKSRRSEEEMRQIANEHFPV